MTIRIGINGVGRIGRNVWRIVHTDAPDLEIAAANDIADLTTVTHLLRHDSLRGRFPGHVERGEGAVVVDGRAVPVSHEPRPTQVDWAAHGVDVVIEATGQFTRAAAARGHLRGGAPRVIISTASPDADVSLMMGVNEHEFDPARHRVVSNSCCSTYCLALMVSPLHQTYQVRGGSATIAYAHGSRPGPLLDDVFPDLRMARANATNIVPADVPGVRHAFDRVLPALAGRFTATALRVPVRATSTATLTLRLTHPVSAEEINHTLSTASSSILKEYLRVWRAPVVSADVIGTAASCVVDAGLTTVLGDLARVVGWYDNEWGYAHRLLDLTRYLVDRPRSSPGGFGPGLPGPGLPGSVTPPG